MGIFLNKAQRAEKKTLHMLENAKDSEFIRACAENDPSEKVRLAAVAKIDAPDVLIGIVRNTRFGTVKQAAILKLGAQDVFAIAKKSESELTTQGCFERLGVMGRADLQEAFIREYPQRAEQLVQSITDPQRLLRLYWDGIAKSRIYDVMRRDFVEHMTPEMRLNEDIDKDALFAAIGNATDQMALAKRLSSSSFDGATEYKVRSAIAERLTNPAALKYAALRLDDKNAMRCIDKLGTKSMEDAAFRNAALFAPSKKVVCCALNELNDNQLYMVAVIRGRMNEKYREEALHRMKDIELIKKLASTCDNTDIAQKAAVVSGDETLMRGALEKCKYRDQFTDILGIILDAEPLERIALDEPDPLILEKYIGHLRELGAYCAGRRIEKKYVCSLENDRAGWMKRYLAYMSQRRENLVDMLFAGSMTKAVTDKLEALLKEGNAEAGNALIRLYLSKDFNPALKGHAAEQQLRIKQQHTDRMVDSTECGVTFVHRDAVTSETIKPL